MLSFNESAWGGWWIIPVWMIPIFPVCGVQGALRSSSHQIVWQRTPVTLEQALLWGKRGSESKHVLLCCWQVMCGGLGPSLILITV